MSQKFLFLLILFICSFSCLIQAKSASGQSLEWFRTYDDTGHTGRCIQQTSDSGYIVAAGTLLIKTDPSGHIVWIGQYFVPDLPRICHVDCVQQTYDSGYIATGWAHWPLRRRDVILIKTDSAGSPLWIRHFGGDSSDVGWSVRQTTDSGFVIAGWTKSFGAGNRDVYLIKTDSAGHCLWDTTYGGSEWDEGRSVWQTTDSGYIVAGRTGSFGAGSEDCYLIKTDSTGDTLWTRTYGGAGIDWTYSVQQTFDGGYIAAGETYSYGLIPDVYLTKTSPAGDSLWARTYGSYSLEGGYSVQQTYDSGYIVCGYTTLLDPDETDLYLIKTDAAGDTIWTRAFGGYLEEYGYSVQQTLDSGYIVTGYSTSYDGGEADVYLIKVTHYQRGDANRDGCINIADLLYLINYLFIGGSAPEPLGAGDACYDDLVNIGDVVYVINYLFLGGSPPP